jgi:hypothetical protein
MHVVFNWGRLCCTSLCLVLCVCPGHASALGALIHLLRSPSRVMRKQGEAFLREHYHMRPSGAVQVSAASSKADMSS